MMGWLGCHTLITWSFTTMASVLVEPVVLGATCASTGPDALERENLIQLGDLVSDHAQPSRARSVQVPPPAGNSALDGNPRSQVCEIEIDCAPIWSVAER
jgi:hypothetical protein